MIINPESGSIPIGTAVNTFIGLGFIVGHRVDRENKILDYLVTFDHYLPGSIRPDPFYPITAWAFKAEDIKIYLEGENKNVH